MKKAYQISELAIDAILGEIKPGMTELQVIGIAQREIYKNATGEYPVLLLDDVLSELDPKRQEFVLNRINGGQVFITCCEDDRLPQLLGGKVLHVHGGELV